MVTQTGTWFVFRGSLRLPSQESRVPALPNFGGSPVFMPTSFNAERPNSAYGEGRVFRSAKRHVIGICTNASRGLSAIAEFLVNYVRITKIS